MKHRIPLLAAALVLAACSTPSDREEAGTSPGAAIPSPAAPPGASRAASLNAYKRQLAERIAQASPGKVFEGRPQALLRSVVVVRYVVDAQGNLARSEIMRSNRDSVTEATALSTLRTAAPFPRPSSSLLSRGRVEIMETWLFNNDGRFQLRTIAEPQMDR